MVAGRKRMSTVEVAARKAQKGTSSSMDVGSSTPAEEVIQTSFRLPRSRWARLQQLSIDERLSVQAIIIASLEGEFKRRGRKF